MLLRRHKINAAKQNEEVTIDDVRQKVVYGDELKYEVEQDKFPVQSTNEYSKTAINRMSTSDLQTFATEQGIDNAEELTGTELKKLLIEKLGL
jgi:hypothetical protein